jgi:hypothetical protein
MTETPERTVMTSLDECRELTDISPAPEASGLRSTALVQVEATIDKVPAQGWLLVAQRPEGLCLIDSPLEPAATLGGYYRADFQYSWSAEARPLTFRLQAQERRYQMLDEEEVDESERAAQSDESDESEEPGLADQTCVRYAYAVIDGRFTRTSASETEGPCDESFVNDSRAR